VLVGSHLDTVPCGGKLDGALGVVAAVHAVKRLQEQGVEPPRPVWVVAFMDEEGTRFDAALFGSRAFAGESLADLGDRVDGDGTTLREALLAHGASLERVGEASRIDEIGAYLELHVEQGPLLEATGVQIARSPRSSACAATACRCAGRRTTRARRRWHCGETPSRAPHGSRSVGEAARGRERVTANVGRVGVAPGGANVVPASPSSRSTCARRRPKAWRSWNGSSRRSSSGSRARNGSSPSSS
jgi:acetylornithine deacetylase/succinyl-diaminopimelate desuccinylase-like protein